MQHESSITRQAFLTSIRPESSGFGDWENETALSFEETYNILERCHWFFVEDAPFESEWGMSGPIKVD